MIIVTFFVSKDLNHLVDLWQYMHVSTSLILSLLQVKYLRLDPLESAAWEVTVKEEQSVSTDLLLYMGGYRWCLLR